MALNFANNNSLSAITSLPASISSGSMTLIQEQTASSSSTISFTSGIDSTYDEYVFKFINIHPQNDQAGFEFQGSTDGGSNYNVTITSSTFKAHHDEADSATSLNYDGDDDQAQGTAFQNLSHKNQIGNDNDQHYSGILRIFNPSSSVFVKHFISQGVESHYADYIINTFFAGYFNTTSPINAFQFKMHSGNIDAGVIKLYGVS